MHNVVSCLRGLSFVVPPASVSNVSTTERGDSGPDKGSAWCRDEGSGSRV